MIGTKLVGQADIWLETNAEGCPTIKKFASIAPLQSACVLSSAFSSLGCTRLASF